MLAANIQMGAQVQAQAKTRKETYRNSDYLERERKDKIWPSLFLRFPSLKMCTRDTTKPR